MDPVHDGVLIDEALHDLDEALHDLDDALIRLRRVLTAPMPVRVRVRAGVGERVELSTVLVTDAVNRTRVDGGYPATVADIAFRLAVAPSTASRLVDRAVAARMVARETDRHDGRKCRLSVTTRGHTLLARADAARNAYLRRVMSEWSDADVVTFCALLTRFATDTGRRSGPDLEENP